MIVALRSETPEDISCIQKSTSSMKLQFVLMFVSFAYFIMSFLPASTATLISFPEEDELPIEDYIDNDMERILYGGGMQKRGCVGRGGNCDHMPNDCCDTTTCKCNLWGANCRCQRKGWFQKWGK